VSTGRAGSKRSSRARARKRSARLPELDPERIAAAALAVVDKHGAGGFTMRAVANALGVTPMALYHHVGDKAGLATLVVDAASKEVSLPAPTGRWPDDMWQMARWSRRAMMAHPAVRRLRSAHRVWTPAILHMTERWMSLWQQSGLPLNAAVRGARMSSIAITGLIEQEMAMREMAPPDPSVLAMLPSARLVFTTAPNLDADFETTVRALIDGLHERLRG
jgi:AcrR family transcriptional regulator